MGQALGSRYFLEETLGQGGMGSVHRAVQREGGPDLAVKLLQPALCQDPSLVARFVQERSIMLSVGGEHVVRVHDMVVEGDSLAIVMDYLPGGSLRTYLNENAPLPRDAYLNLTRQILVGLVAVHDAGIVHRDIKPANLLVDERDGELRIKVTDFGISRVMDSPHLTTVTSSIGTPSYMAPELVESAKDSPAADVYAVGIVLYEMVAGKTPFAGPGGPMAMWWRHANVEPTRPDGVDDAVWEIIQHFLRKDPQLRPRDAREAIAAMIQAELISEDVLSDLGPRPAPAPIIVPEPTESDDDDRTRMRLPGQREAAQPPRVTDIPAGAAAPEGRSRRFLGKSRLIMLAAVLVVAAGSPAAFLLSKSGSSPDTTVSLPFAVESYPQSGLDVSRTWVLNGSNLHGELIVHSNKGGRQTFEEVLPKSMIADAGKISFQPQPVVVRADPVVRYTVDAPVGGQETFDYDVPVASGVVTLARLQGWAADQSRESAAYRSQAHVTAPVTLAGMQITPATLQLTARGAAHKLTLRGLMSNFHAAGAAMLSKAQWNSSAPSVASVSRDGTLSPRSAGKATITAVLGTVKATMSVDVAAPIAGSTPSARQAPASFGQPQSRSPKSSVTTATTRSKSVTSPPRPQPDQVACPSPSVLVGGSCIPQQTPQCDPPNVLIGGVCTTPTSTCESPNTLDNGVCVPLVPSCDPPSTLENGVCVSPQPPPPACDPPNTLVDGVCVTPEPPTPDPGTSPDLSTDDTSTGAVPSADAS